jgi:phosphatidylglycerol---prolipoprotein diacylglyceryl transferase
VLGTITIGIDPIALHIGSGGIHWYGVMYVVAFLVGFRYGALPHMLARGATRDQVERMTGWTILTGLIGGRLYYVVQNDPGYYITHPIHILAVWEGGMAFFGAILTGLATAAFLARRERLSVWTTMDAAAFFAVVGQPIGRIGNIINGDILGAPSTLPWATAYTNPNAVLQKGFDLCTPAHCVAYQPAAVYEAIGTILIGVVLVWLRRRSVRPGLVVICYVALYAISQLILFQFRQSEPVLWLGLKQAQLTSIFVLVVAVPLLILAWRRTNREVTKPEPAEGVPAAAS